MHYLNAHLTQSLADRLKKRRVVIWYDPRREFTTFIAEMAGGTAPENCQIDSVEVSGKSTGLCVMQESFFEVKFAAETCVAQGGQPGGANRGQPGASQLVISERDFFPPSFSQ